MAARVRKIRHDEETRAKIKTSQLVNRLTDHVLGSVDLKPTQVTAALGLLRKTLPDLSQTESMSEVVHHFAEVPEVKSRDEWLRQYGVPSGQHSQGLKPN